VSAVTGEVNRPEPRGRRRDPAGYAMVVAAYLLMGGTASLVDLTDAPTSVVLCVRMAFAFLVLAAFFARRSMLRDWRRPGAAPRLLLMGAVSSVSALLLFVAIRATGVAIAMILLFMMPVWVALAAPRIFGLRREPIVLPALALALTGLAVILAPGLFGDDARTSAAGLAAGLGSGLAYAAFVLLVKDLTRRVASTTVTFSEAGLDALFLLPLALWQLSDTGYQFTLRDLVVLVVMGVVFTALAHTLWTEGTRRVRVEHVSILGYVEPVAAPIYALVLLGQEPGLWTIAGGALVLAAGLLVIVFGRAEGDSSLAALAEAEPL
jgi:drug/metabolite transporter (DMT)-like permease